MPTLRTSVVLAFSAMLLQIAVFLQPLIPEQYKIARVCQTVAEIQQQSSMHHTHQTVTDIKSMLKSDVEHQHDVHNECLFCVVYGHLVSDLNSDIAEIFDRIQVRLIAFQKTFKHIFFYLQRLFLNPQGRAPPLLA